MSSGRAYRPTSLDYINRPNPVEPQSAPQTHPLYFGAPSQQDLLRVLLDSGTPSLDQRPAKRRKSQSGNPLVLPELPVRQNAKRPRIPPTLSGLHQPPPDAGILPSINVQQPAVLRAEVPEPVELANPQITVTHSSSTAVVVTSEVGNTKPSKRKPNKWHDDETACLLKGVARFGIGSWTKILRCQDYQFDRRTALDLKDRFRVCRPEDYSAPKKTKSASPKVVSADGNDIRSLTTREKPNDRKCTSELQLLGISAPFAKTSRRKRTAYTAEEDTAILKGFKKHGHSWAAIRADPGLSLTHRKATDLRDRLRNRFPEEYANAGLAPRPEIFPKPPQRERIEAGNKAIESVTSAIADDVVPEANLVTPPPPAQVPKKQAPLPPTSLLSYDDVFFGAPYQEGDEMPELPILDRAILDWPLDTSKIERGGGINPLVTLKLPQPRPSRAYGTGALPSLADVTAGNADDYGEQLELPSLMFAGPEAEGRVGGQFLGWEGLLS